MRNVDWSRWMKRSIWTAGIIGMLSLTINDFIPLVDEYQDKEKNVLTQVSIVTSESVPRPLMALCVPYYGAALGSIENWLWTGNHSLPDYAPQAYHAMKRHGWGVWDLRRNDTNMTEESAANIVKRILKEGDDGFPTLTLNDSYPDAYWNQPIIDAVWRYLSDITALDIGLTPPYPSTDSFQFTGPYYSYFGGNMSMMVGRISNERIDQMFESVYRVILPFGYFNKPFRSSPISIASGSLCIQTDINDQQGPGTDINEGPRTFLFSHRLSVKNNESAEVGLEGSNQDHVMIFEDPSILYSSPLNFRDTPLYTTTTAMKENIEEMQLSYAVESRFIENRTKVRCSKESTPAMCLAKLQVNLTIQYCKCIPFAYRFLRDNSSLITGSRDTLPYCHVTHYEACYETLMKKAMEGVTYCNQKCEHTFYRWKQDIGIYKSGDPVLGWGDTTRMFSLILSPLGGGTPYLEFTVVDKISIQQFFSQLGGSIGLYLGFSGLTAFAVIALSIEFIIWRSRSWKEGSTTAMEDNSTLWTTLWTKNFLHVMANRATGDKKENTETVNDEVMKEIRQAQSRFDDRLNEVTEKMEKKMQIVNEMMENKMKTMSERIEKKMQALSEEFIQRLELVTKTMDQMKDDMATLRNEIRQSAVV